MFGLSFLLLLQGFTLVVTSMCCELKWKKDFTQKVRKFHKLAGYFTIFTGITTIMSGIINYTYKSNWKDLSKAGSLNTTLALLTILILEIIYRIWRKKETPWV